MTTDRINPIVARLTAPGALDAAHLEAARFAALLGTALQPDADNPAWSFYSFALNAGPFTGGELRLSQAGNAALLILTPRDPPGLTEADVDRSAWGPRVSFLPNPRIPPEGADTDVYQVNGVTVSAQWLHVSRRLRSLVLEWAAPQP